MSTEYHLITPVDAEMALENIYTLEELTQGIRRHIGKSSFGWTFFLRSYPELGITSLDAWRLVFALPHSKIVSEYGENISVPKMLKIITKREGNPNPRLPKGYADWNDFHAKNHSQMGPNNLLRCARADNISHGEGTWDMIEGDF